MVCAMHRLFQSEEDDLVMEEGSLPPGKESGMFDGLQAKVRLEGILMGLAGSMLLVSRFNKEFKELLQQRDGISEIRTRDYEVAWCFTASRGRLRVSRGPHPNPDYEMVYQDTPTALAIFLDGSEEATMKAMMDGTLTFQGDLEFGMWFIELLKSLSALMKKNMEKFSRFRSGK
jgi:hypothetical protein